MKKPRKKTAKQTARDRARMDHFIQQKQLSGEFPFASVSHLDFDSVVNREWPIRQELQNVKKVLQASYRVQEDFHDQNQKLVLELETKCSETKTLEKVVKDLEDQIKNLTAEVNDLEKCNQELSSVADLRSKPPSVVCELDNLRKENEKLWTDNATGGANIMQLQENMVKHVRTIKHLERKISPEVNNLQTTSRSHGRGNPHQKQSRRGKRCAEVDCRKYVERCECCGRAMDTDYCYSCKVTTTACTTCLYGDLNGL